MDREFQSSMSNADLKTPTTSRSYKCSKCGNMFPVSQETCEVCGHRCSESDCRVMQASNEGY